MKRVDEETRLEDELFAGDVWTTPVDLSQSCIAGSTMIRPPVLAVGQSTNITSPLHRNLDSSFLCSRESSLSNYRLDLSVPSPPETSHFSVAIRLLFLLPRPLNILSTARPISPRLLRMQAGPADAPKSKDSTEAMQSDVLVSADARRFSTAR